MKHNATEVYVVAAKRFVDGAKKIQHGVKIPTLIPSILNRDPRPWFEFLDPVRETEAGQAAWNDQHWFQSWAPMIPTERRLPT